MSIDWSKAPEWAVAHGLYAFGGEISEVWIGEEQYQRLDQANSFPYGGGAESSFHNPRRYQFRYETPLTVSWNGEGLPPVGTVCEFEVGKGSGDWRVCEVIAIKDEHAVCWIHLNKVLTTKGACLRPIRTAEQIAAEVRENAAKHMYETIRPGKTWEVAHNMARDGIYRAIDAGYGRLVEL